MSGGSMNYVYTHLEYECVGHMGDMELDNLMKDIAKLVHDREWYLSGDICEETYNETVRMFKRKWFEAPRTTRLREYIDNMFLKTHNECLSLIGEVEPSNDPVLKKLVEKYGEYVEKTTAAVIMGVSRQTVYAMLSDGRLKPGYRGRRVSMRSIADYMKGRGDQP